MTYLLTEKEIQKATDTKMPHSLEHGEYIPKYNPIYVTKPTPQTPVTKATEEVHIRIQWYIRTFERAFRC